MRKFIILAVMAMIFMNSCTKEQKCKLLIKEYLSKNLNDFSSYENVEFTEIKPDSSSFSDDSTFKELDDRINYFKFQLKNDLGIELSSEIDEYAVDTSNVNFNDSLLFYMKKSSDFVSKYKMKHIGWIIYHKFRSEEDGSLKLHTGYFHINMDCSKILYAEIR